MATNTAVAAQVGDYTYTVSADKATITGYSGAGGDITIPSSLGGYPVVAIGDRAFHGSTLITAVTIPEGIMSIGPSAFRSCTALTSVTIPDSVTSIGSSAFEQSTSLTSIVFGQGVAAIGNYAFYGCSALSSVTIPASLTSIGSLVFTPCTSLISITVAASNVNYASVDGVLYNKDLTTLIQYPGGKTGAFVVPEDVVSIERYAFYKCNSIASVTIPDNVTSIGFDAFAGCAALDGITVAAGNANYASVDGVLYNRTFTTLVQHPGGKAGAFTIPNSVTSIAWDAFWSCAELTSVTMPDGITSIYSFTFQYCTSLTSVNFGNGVVSIGGFAFWGCTSLTSVIVPDGLASIGAYAFAQTSIVSFTVKENVTLIEDAPFYSCAALNDIVVVAGNANYASVDGVLYNKNLTTLIQYPGGRSGSFVIPSSVVSIRDDAFAYCVALTSVTIPNSVTSIGGESFLRCTALTSVIIGSGVTAIGESAFSGCHNLTSISFLGLMAPTDVAADWLNGASADLRGHAYATSNFPAPGAVWNGLMMGSVLPIPEDYTYSVSGDKATITGYTGVGGPITIPSTLGRYSVAALGNWAFANNTSLTSVTIPDSVTSIGDYAFRACSALTSVTMGNGVASIQTGAFAGCTSLIAVTIPDSVTSIGSSAFERCTSLASVAFGHNVADIGNYAFYNCYALTTVYIPASVISIGYEVFIPCAALTAITVAAGNVNYASVDGVLYNKDLTTLIQYPGGKAGAFVVPENVTSIVGYAFFKCNAITSVTIPDKVTSIGGNAFSGCAGLNEIVVTAGNVNYASVDGVLYNKNLTMLIQYPGGKAGAIAIPDSVTGFGWWAFWSCSKLTSVTMPDGITNIDPFTFQDCTSLTSVDFGHGLVSIEGFAFWGCTSLTTVVLPDSLTTIGHFSFARTAITSFTIPAGITSIGDGAFYMCYALTDIIVDADNMNYASVDGVLYDKALTTLMQYPGGKMGAFVIPSEVVHIEDVAFAYCVGLTSVTISNSVNSIGVESFLHCTALTSVIVGSGVTAIDDFSFSGCGNLTSISFLGLVAPTDVGANWLEKTGASIRGHAYAASNFPAPGAVWNGLIMDSVLPIPEDYTYSVSADKATITGYTGVGGIITIPSTLGGYPVVAIDNIAFALCYSLTSVTIPDSVTSIGYAPFGSCTSLVSIEVAAGNPNYVSIDGVLYDAAIHALIQYPIGNPRTSFMIPDSVTIIGRSSFFDSPTLTSVTIPDSVTTIVRSAFYNCTALTSVTIPDSVTTIGDWVFGWCASLNSVTIGNGVTTIGSLAFYKCPSLTTVTIPDSVTSIGEWAFDCCSSLTSIVVGASNSYYANSAGDGVLYDKELTALFQYPIGNARTSFTVIGSVTSIGHSAFEFCTSLTSVTIGSGVTSIGGYAFASCIALNSISFREMVAPSVGSGWISTKEVIRGHAYAASNFPAPGGNFNGLIMG
ncbi:MAG: leucine-rich repeat domain-containing protein, partial [Methanomassiliicoccales archaeon]